MSLAVLYKTQGSADTPSRSNQLSYGGARIPRADFACLRLADNVLREAEAAAHRIRHDASAAAESTLREARTQGYALGHSEAVTAVLGTLETERRLRDLLADRLADIVEQCVRGLLGEIGESQALSERIHHLLRAASSTPPSNPASASTHAARSAVTLYVSPEQWRAAQDIVTEASQVAFGNVAGLNVVSEEGRARDALLLETRAGFVESDLELTLHDLRNLVRAASTRATNFLEGAP